MALLANDYLTIDYSPQTEVLEVTYGDMYTQPLEVLREQMEVIFQLVNSLGVTKILFDSTKTLSAPSEELSNQIAAFVFSELKKTPIKRLARIKSPAYLTEAKVRQKIGQLQEVEKPPFLVENFSSRDEALEWLSAWANLQVT